MASMIGFDSVELRRSGFTPRGPARDPDTEAGSLGRLVQHEVIPRLLVAHSEPSAPVGSQTPSIVPEDADRLALLSLSLEAHAVLEVVEEYLRRGVDVETVFVELLAPAARRLGRGWEDDSIDFIDVTMGLWRLQEVLREIAARTPRIVRAAEAPHTALFSSMPGEQHSFGAAMVSECFTRAGWDADLMIDGERSLLLRRLAENSFDLIGLTVSCDCNIAPLAPLISAIRSVSRNPSIFVMIGGRVPSIDPALAARAGADATAHTAIEAVVTAERLVAASCGAGPA